MTFSYYYKDPDGNHVELQVDNFGDWGASTEWMRTSPEFHCQPDRGVRGPVNTSCPSSVNNFSKLCLI